MAFIRSALLLLLVVTMFACPEPVKPTTSPDVYSGSDSVYGAGDSAVEDVHHTRDIDEDLPVAFETGDISTERLSMEEANPSSRNLDTNWEPIYFEFDKAVLTEEGKQALRTYGKILLENSALKVLIEGHCDIRGTEEYNLALGERRAQQVKQYLLELGVNQAQVRTISYGELRPLNMAENESAWAENRRVSFTF